MKVLKKGSDIAIVLLHEIYGINQFMRDLCEEYHAWGCDIYCPNLLKTDLVYAYEQEQDAYANFIKNIGFDIVAEVNELVERLSKEYAQVFLIGFSVGATLVWRAASDAKCSGAVCFYGSRIRDYCDLKPGCPTLLIMADQDKSYPVLQIDKDLKAIPNSILKVLNGQHGFCDPYARAYHSISAKEAKHLSYDFISGLFENKR